MATELETYLRLEELRRDFETEARELIAIARSAGDSLEAAIDFATDDPAVGKLWDEMKAIEG